ncbi:hypothetical protein [Azospirillum argentinense]
MKIFWQRRIDVTVRVTDRDCRGRWPPVPPLCLHTDLW